MSININKQGRQVAQSCLQKWGRKNFLQITLRELKWSSQLLQTWPGVLNIRASSFTDTLHVAQGPSSLVCVRSFFSPFCGKEKSFLCACPGEPSVSFCILRTQINQLAPFPEMAILPRNLHICILLFFPEFNFLQELILITLFKQRGFGGLNKYDIFPIELIEYFSFLFFNLKGQ